MAADERLHVTARVREFMFQCAAENTSAAFQHLFSAHHEQLRVHVSLPIEWKQPRCVVDLFFWRHASERAHIMGHAYCADPRWTTEHIWILAFFVSYEIWALERPSACKVWAKAARSTKEVKWTRLWFDGRDEHRSPCAEPTMLTRTETKKLDMPVSSGPKDKEKENPLGVGGVSI